MYLPLSVGESHPVPAQALPTYENVVVEDRACVGAVVDFVLHIRPITVTIMLVSCSSPSPSRSLRPRGDAQHLPLRPPVQLPLVRGNTWAVLP